MAGQSHTIQARGSFEVSRSLTSQIDKVIVLQPVDGLELAAHIKLLCRLEEVLDRGVLLVTAKHLLRLDSPEEEGSCQHLQQSRCRHSLGTP
jgi:hypothetical protein